jgi:hypothetical protein
VRFSDDPLRFVQGLANTRSFLRSDFTHQTFETTQLRFLPKKASLKVRQAFKIIRLVDTCHGGCLSFGNLVVNTHDQKDTASWARTRNP